MCTSRAVVPMYIFRRLGKEKAKEGSESFVFFEICRKENGFKLYYAKKETFFSAAATAVDFLRARSSSKVSQFGNLLKTKVHRKNFQRFARDITKFHASTTCNEVIIIRKSRVGASSAYG